MMYCAEISKMNEFLKDFGYTPKLPIALTFFPDRINLCIYLYGYEHYRSVKGNDAEDVISTAWEILRGIPNNPSTKFYQELEDLRTRARAAGVTL